MTARKTRIAIDNLPPRARVLAPKDMSTLFGGCNWYQGLCKSDSDCCMLACYVGFINAWWPKGYGACL